MSQPSILYILQQSYSNGSMLKVSFIHIHETQDCFIQYNLLSRSTPGLSTVPNFHSFNNNLLNNNHLIVIWLSKLLNNSGLANYQIEYQSSQPTGYSIWYRLPSLFWNKQSLAASMSSFLMPDFRICMGNCIQLQTIVSTSLIGFMIKGPQTLLDILHEYLWIFRKTSWFLSTYFLLNLIYILVPYIKKKYRVPTKLG